MKRFTPKKAMLGWVAALGFLLASPLAASVQHQPVTPQPATPQPATPQPNLPARNPSVAHSPYAISHHNSAQTDVTEVNGPSVGGRLGLDEVRTVPAVSAANGLVYIANRRNDTYEYFAADWETGENKATWLFPNDSVLWNNWGGITVFLPDGDFFIGWLLRSQALRYGCYEVVVATRNTESYVVT
tara:strand:+ start:8240 stop:8797 length:558 start_codon:yes stop_codon:yes gene_type:complete